MTQLPVLSNLPALTALNCTNHFKLGLLGKMCCEMSVGVRLGGGVGGGGGGAIGVASSSLGALLYFHFSAEVINGRVGD